MKRLVFIQIILCIFSGCRFNSKNIDGYDFSCSNYRECYVMLDKGERITLYDINKNDLSKGVKLTFINAKDTVVKILGKESIIIDAYIDSFEDYYRYVLIKQKPLDSICECLPECYDKYSIHKDSYEACKNAISKTKIINYWIIDKSKDFIYGPLSKEIYDKHINLINLK